MSTRLSIIVTALLALVTAGCITISLFPQAMPLREKTVQGTAADKILRMDISGVISEKGSSNPLSESEDLVARIKEELTLAAEDSHIKALLLRINSPGGTVTASDVIHHEINEFKSKRKIPVVAVIMDIGASGGYYVAVAADQIIAHPTSVTGSVGVIMLRVQAEGLLQKIRVGTGPLKSGPQKDLGPPLRPASEGERAIFHSILNAVQARFLEGVTQGGEGPPADQLQTLPDR